ncbi:hypothetical protein F5887DRAFT_386130 [Amanita rubescens]|nr:hypothetical protein F5887DRAFT_386130 [Amanita rubescens]
MNELFKLKNRMPTIFILKFFAPSSPGLEIFPASHRPGQVLQECGGVARSLREFPTYHYYLGDRCHLTFNLFGITGENIDLLAEVMEGIATCFRDMDFMAVEIITDDMTIRPWRFPGFNKALPLFETVENVSFHFPGIKGDDMDLLSTDLHRCLVMYLGKAWPKVQQVRVRRAAITCMWLNRTSDWNPVSGVYWDSDDDDLINEDE